MLEFAVLGLLLESKRHGYELRRALGELGFWKVSFGSLYPALKRLEKRGAIEATKASGRRKAYRITASGVEVFNALLRTDPEVTETTRSFQIRLAFLGNLPSLHRIQIMDRRRRELFSQLRIARETLVKARSITENKDRYRIALMEHSMQSTQADIAWIDGLLAVERGVAATTN